MMGPLTSAAMAAEPAPWWYVLVVAAVLVAPLLLAALRGRAGR